MPIPRGWRVSLGDSIAIDGVCATVQNLTKETFEVFFMTETIKRTSLRSLPDNHQFNLEQPLRLNDMLGGHLVSGHIDTTATVSAVAELKDSKDITFTINTKFMRYIIYKGSICVNGVSLTVTNVGKDNFSVSLIPYTISHTNLGGLTKGNTVNIEVDMMAKYLENFLKPYLSTPSRLNTMSSPRRRGTST